MKKIFVSRKNSKAIAPVKFVLKLLQRLDLNNSNTHVAFDKLNNISKTKELKIKAPTWNNEFQSPGGSYSVSDIQDYI